MKNFLRIFFVLFLLPSVALPADRNNSRDRAMAVAESKAQVSRTAITPQKQISSRSAIQTTLRKISLDRAMIKPADKPTKAISSRAAVPIQTATEYLGDGYTTCRDAYFACMDQFCALRSDTYRRCMCSSRLQQIRERERNFETATGMIKVFEDNNLNVVDKSASEVKAMYNASDGEEGMKEDKSESKKQLSGINQILSAKPSDSANNMKNMTAIWDTTNMVSGSDIAKLESTSLYNAVHAQCTEMVAPSCVRAATFNMVASAYGMYIEQDCTALKNSLDKKQREMVNNTKVASDALETARLENYNEHNSDEITACLDKVRTDMYGDAACGKNNVKCVDYSGRFININSGEPIYTVDFYMLRDSISLSGDVLNNSTNMPYINMLNDKKVVAKSSLDKCRDVSNEVWDEYVRQTLVDLSQQQMSKVKEVQNKCIQTVSDCYDEKLEQLRQFSSDISQENVAAQQTSLTEEMCKQKLDTCAILYGGGPPGLEKLKNYVKNTQTVKLESTCEKYLSDYVEESCTPVGDNMHEFPYQCRFYKPGQQQTKDSDTLYARIRTKALDVCTREGELTLTSNVEMVISKIMDNLKLKMDEQLSDECTLISGAWHSRTLGTFEGGTQATQFMSKVGSHTDWGICVK
jgi:hypothetical protein